jgi:hypothetical protein
VCLVVGVQVTWSPEQQAALKGFVAQVPPLILQYALSNTHSDLEKSRI